MTKEEQFQERVVRVERPVKHYSLLCAANGDNLGVGDGKRLGTFEYVDDKAVWESQSGGEAYRHVTTGLTLTAESLASGVCLRHEGKALASDGTTAEQGAPFTVQHGPADLPSEYLRHLKENGWVCLPCILSAEIVDGLQRVSSSGAYSDRPYDPRKVPLTEDSAVAKTTVEPVSVWLIRQYLQTDQIRLGHSPSLAVLRPDDGKRDVLAWHSDFPYLWGITSRVGGDRIPVHDSGAFCMAIQRNVCITDFTKENGATCFKLGSHTERAARPEEWGTAAAYSEPGYRAEHGLPYTGPEAEVLEAPAGSIVAYDARTWHRTGINRTDEKRGAMLQSVVPMYIMPFMDVSRPYKAFVSSPLVDELTAREQKELEALMVHKIVGPMGQFAIGVDWELTETTRAKSASDQGTY